jgi:hypothetical protein
MNATMPRGRSSWAQYLLIGFTLVLIGAAAAIWALAHYGAAARFLGVVPAPAVRPAPQAVASQPPQALPSVAPAQALTDAQLAQIDARIDQLENAVQRTEGSAGRADALVVAFAARRAIDRGVSLGYLETLLVGRFGAQHQRAVATVITASRNPVRLDQLIAQYEQLGPELRARGPQESWWSGFKRELGSLIEVRRADRPPSNPDARYSRALARLRSGEVDAALAETMRLPGASRAGGWVAKARRYVSAHRALDEIESAALLGGG